MSDESGPPDERRHPTRSTIVIGGLVLLGVAVAMLGLMFTGVQSGRAAAYGECRTAAQSGCVTRSSVALQDAGSRKNRTIWTADGVSEFTLRRSDADDLGLEDGKIVDLLTYGSQVLAVETSQGRFDLPTSGYRRTLGGAMGLVAVLSIAVGSAIQVRTGSDSRITDRSSWVCVGVCVGMGVGFVLLLSGASITATGITAAATAGLGALVGALVRPEILDRWDRV